VPFRERPINIGFLFEETSALELLLYQNFPVLLSNTIFENPSILKAILSLATKLSVPILVTSYKLFDFIAEH
jgi:hypothetical protein